MNKKKIILIAIVIIVVAGGAIWIFSGSKAKHKISYTTVTVR